MGTTSNYSLPYPAITDAPNGPAQIQALAEAVDSAIDTTISGVTGQDTDWSDITPTGAWSLHATIPMRARVRSGWASLYGGWTRSSSFPYVPNGWETFGSLPASVPTPDRDYEHVIVTSAGLLMYGRIQTTGDIGVFLPSAGGELDPATNIYFAAAWPVS